MGEPQPGPWKPDDPFNAMAESFRLQVLNMFLDAEKATIYRDLGPMKQVECFMAGTMTALIGVCFAHIRPAGRNEMMKMIRKYLPQARLNAEAMLPKTPPVSERTVETLAAQSVVAAGILCVGEPRLSLIKAFATALHSYGKQMEAAATERAAKIADSFTCGLCGMDGKTGTAIRQSLIQEGEPAFPPARDGEGR